jgi:hypothetical protein
VVGLCATRIRLDWVSGLASALQLRPDVASWIGTSKLAGDQRITTQVQPQGDLAEAFGYPDCRENVEVIAEVLRVATTLRNGSC